MRRWVCHHLAGFRWLEMSGSGALIGSIHRHTPTATHLLAQEYGASVAGVGEPNKPFQIILQAAANTECEGAMYWLSMCGSGTAFMRHEASRNPRFWHVLKQHRFMPPKTLFKIQAIVEGFCATVVADMAYLRRSRLVRFQTSLL